MLFRSRGSKIKKAEKQVIYLDTLRSGGLKKDAQEKAGASRQVVSLWRSSDPYFRVMEQEAVKSNLETRENDRG